MLLAANNIPQMTAADFMRFSAANPPAVAKLLDTLFMYIIVKMVARKIKICVGVLLKFNINLNALRRDCVSNQ